MGIDAGDFVRLSIPGNCCVHCGATIRRSVQCPGCGWIDPLTEACPDKTEEPMDEEMFQGRTWDEWIKAAVKDIEHARTDFVQRAVRLAAHDGTDREKARQIASDAWLAGMQVLFTTSP